MKTLIVSLLTCLLLLTGFPIPPSRGTGGGSSSLRVINLLRLLGRVLDRVSQPVKLDLILVVRVDVRREVKVDERGQKRKDLLPDGA
jgi:hypothetical protein